MSATTTQTIRLFDCPVCGKTVELKAIRGYRADYPDSPIRPTRTEAEQDWCDYMRAKEDR